MLRQIMRVNIYEGAIIIGFPKTKLWYVKVGAKNEGNLGKGNSNFIWPALVNPPTMC